MKNAKEADPDIVKNNERKIIFNNNYRKKKEGEKVKQHATGMREIIWSKTIPI